MIDAILNFVVNPMYSGKIFGPNIWTEDNSSALGMGATLEGKAGDIAFYYIHFEIIGDAYILIGSHWCDLFRNRTVFCSKSHLFPNR